jgi:hypothetical protein
MQGMEGCARAVEALVQGMTEAQLKSEARCGACAGGGLQATGAVPKHYPLLTLPAGLLPDLLRLAVVKGRSLEVGESPNIVVRLVGPEAVLHALTDLVDGDSLRLEVPPPPGAQKTPKVAPSAAAKRSEPQFGFGVFKHYPKQLETDQVYVEEKLHTLPLKPFMGTPLALAEFMWSCKVDFSLAPALQSWSALASLDAAAEYYTEV